MDPEAVAVAAGALAAERLSLERTAGMIGSVLDGVAVALPGGRTAPAAEATGAALAAAVRSAAAELAVLAAALGAAAKEYVAVEHDAATGLERAGRRPV